MKASSEYNEHLCHCDSINDVSYTQREQNGDNQQQLSARNGR